ncbi:MAG: OmpA family protein, partial [Saprospiraceae bacterium]
VNLVPNPGFELFSDEPYGWYYSGKDFSRVSLYWTSPNASSPDIYAPKVIIPNSWKAVGFGNVKSYEGKSHAGITVYGCEQGKPHCREYVQVQLTEPLVPGQRYGYSCMLAHLQKSVAVRNIDLAFSTHEIEEPAHDPISIEPTLNLDRWIPSDGKWYRWSGHFVADDASSFLLIGNFNTDENSQIKMPWKSDLRYGYYYIDDVRLFKIPPILKTPPADSPLANYLPSEGGIVNLSRIYFEHDRTDFMPQAVIQLKQLLDFLKRYPDLQVEIRGHTDNVGTDDYNQILSQRRSVAVVSWLVTKGIAKNRLISSGFGSSEPISTNATSAGRSQNRRVEVKVISL